MTVTIPMAWYKDSKDITLPSANLIDILVPEELSRADDLEALINRRLDKPNGTPAFDELCQDKHKICVIISDLSRPMETNRVLPVLLKRIEQANPQAKVNIIVAQGTHRALSVQEKHVLCGDWVMENYPVLDHAFDDNSQLHYLENSRPEFPIRINKILFESDLRIGVGAVKPHPIFGWSGGAKIVIPGVSGYDTTGYSHWISCPYKGTEIMGLEENPVRSEVEGVVREANVLDFVLNAVLTDQSEVADIFCGDFVAAHRDCVKLAKQYYVKDVDEGADAVIVGVGKWGADFWVGSMAVYQTEFYLKKGGTIVVLAACPEGVSATHTEIVDYGYRPYHEVKKLVDDGTLADDLTLAAHLVHVGRVLEACEAECVMLSEGISRKEANRLGFSYMDSKEEIIPYLKQKHGENVRILAIPGFNSTNVISSKRAGEGEV